MIGLIVGIDDAPIVGGGDKGPNISSGLSGLSGLKLELVLVMLPARLSEKRRTTTNTKTIQVSLQSQLADILERSLAIGGVVPTARRRVPTRAVRVTGCLRLEAQLCA